MKQYPVFQFSKQTKREGEKFQLYTSSALYMDLLTFVLLKPTITFFWKIYSNLEKNSVVCDSISIALLFPFLKHCDQPSRQQLGK